MEYCHRSLYYIFSVLFLPLLVFTSCCGPDKECDPLEEMGNGVNQWTGVAVSKEGRIFVNYPRWSDDVPISVAEVVRGDAMPFPDLEWNSESEDHFIAVQSVYVDSKDRLWVLDTRNPKFKGVLEGGPVLFCFNLSNNSLIEKYYFPSDTYQKGSYFNDLRVDCKYDVVYLTDSGSGALVILDLKNKEVKRRLSQHYSTKSEKDHLMCNGVRWDNSVDSDGIALTPDGQFLYYIALTGHTLYRIPTVVLRDYCLDDAEVAVYVEKVTEVPATDGMMFDSKGNLWMGGLEDDAINRLSSRNELEQVIKDERIKWADSFAIDGNGFVYFPTSQIYLDEKDRGKYKLYRFLPPVLKK
ncbi:SMP-30/gluconolactonase/LRE family protein [Halosquirtibacter xylanolyticus]|uniref:L-dopachrome tautomerase-related protein n=1 Tax=Halosquirtibacter xylanolyticus TaxID=3374599 RepID=UPI003748D2F4|nr:SMP-30/gluconolactonase/LRE family protein [Prolixibacteraceae bacterium]